MRKTISGALALALAIALLLALHVSAAGSQPPDSFSFTIYGDEGHYVVDGNGNLRSYASKSQAPESPASGTPPAASATPPAEPVIPAESAEGIDAAEFAAEVLRLVNAEREQAGLPAFQTDPALSQMAQQRAGELKVSYSHTRPNGERPESIFEEYGVTLVCQGENIAMNTTPAAVVKAWMDSDGHRANILRESAVYLGVGCETGGPHGWQYWVQLFAK